MRIRRFFFSWQFIAAIALPCWLFVGWGLFRGNGVDFLAVLFGAPLLTAAMLVVGAITFFRKSVRRDRAVGWTDVLILSVWHAVIIALGFFTVASGLLAAATIVIGLAALWHAIWRLVTETRQRINSVLSAIDEQARRRAGPDPRTFGPIDGGEMVVIEEKRDDNR